MSGPRVEEEEDNDVNKTVYCYKQQGLPARVFVTTVRYLLLRSCCVSVLHLIIDILASIFNLYCI